jgi:light-regulated signal transduction histidine kinase (bacteriophytochrome)
MGDNNQLNNKTRRSFLTGGLADKGKKDMIKMLSADGNIVEVERSVVEAASTKQRSSNQEIYQWMNNPSKENNC